jgi:hypothetical protein
MLYLFCGYETVSYAEERRKKLDRFFDNRVLRLQLRITANKMQRFLNLFIFTDALYVFQMVPPPIIRST